MEGLGWAGGNPGLSPPPRTEEEAEARGGDINSRGSPSSRHPAQRACNHLQLHLHFSLWTDGQMDTSLGSSLTHSLNFDWAPIGAGHT